MAKRLRRLLTLGSVLTALSPASGQATSVSYFGGDGRSGGVGFLGVHGRQHDNKITISYERGGFIIKDPRSVVRGCIRITVHKARCVDRARGGSEAGIDGETGNDRMVLNDSMPRATNVSLYGGEGRDVLLGNRANEFIEAGRGVDVVVSCPC